MSNTPGETEGDEIRRSESESLDLVSFTRLIAKAIWETLRGNRREVEVTSIDEPNLGQRACGSAKGDNDGNG